MIRFSNGHELTFACGSGALAFDGRGWPWEHPLRWIGVLDPRAFTVVAKTVTREPRKGNLRWWCPWRSVRLLPNEAAVNAISLTNPGIEVWADKHYPRAIQQGYKIAASVYPEGDSDYVASLVPFLKPLDLAYVEVNPSCPNVNHGLGNFTTALSILQEAGKPLVVKLGYEQVARKFVEAIDSYVEAYHLINTVPWDRVFPDRRSPLQKYSHGMKGGVSGPPIFNAAVRCAYAMPCYTNKPVIAGGGISSLEDVITLRQAGARAFSIGTLFLRAPWKPNQIVRQYQQRFRVPGGMKAVRTES